MTDTFNEIKPGVPLTDKEKEALTKSNIEATGEAQRLAAERRMRDMQNGGDGKPLAMAVADSIKEKLESQFPPEKGSE